MAASHRRHDISDRVWQILAPLCPAARARWADPPRTTAGFSTPYSGYYAPARLGGTFPQTTVRQRRRRTLIVATAAGGDRGVWDWLLAAVIDDPDFEWLMIDASHIKVHLHAAGAVGGNQAIARTKGG